MIIGHFISNIRYRSYTPIPPLQNSTRQQSLGTLVLLALLILNFCSVTCASQPDSAQHQSYPGNLENGVGEQKVAQVFESPASVNLSHANLTSDAPPSLPTTLSWKAWIYLAIVLCMFVALLLSLAPMFAILGFSATLLYATGILTSEQLFSGFVTDGVLGIAMLFVVVHPIVQLPGMKFLVQLVLGKVPPAGDAVARRKASSPVATRWALFKLCSLCMLTSPFLENTPQAAMFTPLVTAHCREIGIAPSQILMPMNVAISLGNWALLGTTSNILLSSEMESMHVGRLEFLELAKTNLPILIPALLYLVFVPMFLLPERRGGQTFYAAIRINPMSPYVGAKVSTILQSFLKNRKDDVDKIVVVRASGRRVVEPFSRMIALEEGDELIVAGLVDTLSHCRAVESEMVVGEGKKDISMNLLENDYLSVPATEATTGTSSRGSTGLADRTSNPGYLESSLENLVDALFRGEIPKEFSGPQSREMTYESLTALTPKERLRSGSSPIDDVSSGANFASMKPTHTFGADTISRLTPDLTTKFIIRFNEEYGAVLMTLKVSKEGSNLLEDNVAFAMAPTASTIVRHQTVTLIDESHVSLSTPDPKAAKAKEGHENETTVVISGAPHPEPSSPSSAAAADQVVPEVPKTLAERHKAAGGKIYAFRVPSWFPIGSVDVPDNTKKNDDAHQNDHDHGHAGDDHHADHATPAPASPQSNGKQVAGTPVIKIVTLPWFYQYISILVFIGIIVATVLHVELKISCLVSCVTVVVLQLITTKELARALPVEIYLLIGFSFPLGIGMRESGLAAVLEEQLVNANLEGFSLLIVIGLMALILTNMITTQGASQVLLHLVVRVYRTKGLDPLPGIAMLANTLVCALLTPFAVPANAIIVTPGGYRAKDYIKFGVLLTLIYWVFCAVFVASVYGVW